MDEGKFVADFLTANLEKIAAFGKKAFGKLDAKIQVSLKTAYTDYLTNTRLKHSMSKSFFIRSHPVELYSYYVPTGIACGKRIINKPSFFETISFSNRVAISGTGGSGKSILLKHLFLDCISTKEYAPILVELRDLNNYEGTLEDHINNILKIYGFNISIDYINLAKQAGHFSYFLDGLDEVTPKLRGKLIEEILSLAKKNPKCPIILSSRPDDLLNGIDEFSIFRMLPLNLEEAISLVGKLPYEEIIKEKFCKDLKEGLFESHKSFLSNPLLLSIMLLTYGENAQIPSKLSIFYNQAYEALFQRHDAGKGGYRRGRSTSLDIQDFSKVFSLFALQTYEKRLIKMPRTLCLEFIKKSIDSLNLNVSPEDYLVDLLSAACLMIEDGLEIAFSHRSFQEYFVACQISSSPPEVQKKLLDRYWNFIDYDNVIELLLELNPDLVERELLTPRLEEFFHTLKIKRTIGITHLSRYMKLMFSSVSIEEDRFGFSINNGKGRFLRLLNIVAKKYGGFSYPQRNEEERKLFYSYIYLTYGKGKISEFKTKSLTSRSPFLKELNNLNSGMSISFLKAIHSGYKKLKAKHQNALHNLDSLLGIK